MKIAAYYHKLENYKVQCVLCPNLCIILSDKIGICKVRKNTNGILYSENYGKLAGINFDPIEKKPLYHFYPGTEILSIGSVGCNLSCTFCQNWHSSQSSCYDYPSLAEYKPDDLVLAALSRKSNLGIAYTYNEPIVFFEFMVDVAHKIKEKGLKNVMVSNGYIKKEPLAELIEVMDAFNIDLKSFNPNFYKNLTSSSLEPVKETLKAIRKSGTHLEITHLIITDENDDIEEFTEMINWISGELGQDMVLHLSRYFPSYKLNNSKTSLETMQLFYETAKKKLNHVYFGNVNTENGQHTFCQQCDRILIKRSGYFIQTDNLQKDGKCISCGIQVIKNI